MICTFLLSKCDVPGCQRMFRNPRSYQSHLRRDHADFQRSTFTEHVCGVNGEQLTQEEEEIAMEVAGTEPDIGESLCTSDIYMCKW